MWDLWKIFEYSSELVCIFVCVTTHNLPNDDNSRESVEQQ